MNDTQKYIRAYQKALPRFKEKVMASLLMLAMSAAMVTSATFAWISLSTAPEVSNIETTVAANGNLEIALSDKDGAEPDRSEVGDSGKNIVLKNTTWGNLINLSDSSYGLEKLDLRPAELNLTGNLLTTPLKVVTYGSDGRVNKFSTSLKYANWDTEKQAYLVPNVPEYGVRAITTVTYKNLTGNKEYADMVTQLDSNFSNATNIYFEIIGDDNVIEALKGLIEAFVDNKLNGGSPDVTKYVPALYDMMLRFTDYVEAVGGVMCDIAHMQQYPHFDKDSRKYYTVEKLVAASDSELETQKISLPYLSEYKTLRTKLATYTAQMKTHNDNVESGGTVVWQDISTIVNFMVDIPTTTINGIAANDLEVSNAAGMIFGKQKAVINKGAVKDMEQLTGAKMYINEISIAATVSGINATVRASVETSAATPFPLVESKTGVDNYEGGFAGGDAVANDTYAMAIDFWLRTNSSNAYVVLEGSPVIEQVEQYDVDGNVIVDENDDPILIDAVTGYEGANRVWDDATLSEYSTTQGNGSCYVFYSDDPATQKKTLELVAAMKVAFIDETGNAVAHAYMDTAHAFQETGKVTVPLVLDSRSVPVLDQDGNAVLDGDGNAVYAVTQMEKNIAQRITAIFYIDGKELFNENVLADSKIQGQLNIQFGMNEQMIPATDDELKYEEYLITAAVSKNEFDYDTDTDLSTEVTLTVSGLEPETVNASFIRAINDLQGSREPQITFQPTGEQNKWNATMTFDSPGNYVLREVILDGVTYTLEQPVKVTVEGNGIKSLYCDKIQGGNSQTIMTADSSVEASYELVMASTTNKTQTIQGVIFDDSGKQLIAEFVSQAGSYTTKVKFNTSGTYTMEYLIIDGDWYEIPDNIKKELKLYLGMKADVKLSRTEFLLEGAQTVNVYVDILNDMGDEISGELIAEELGADAEVEIRYYHGSTSNVAPDTNLTWVAERDRYEGQLVISVAGKYSFGLLKLGSNNITNADSPVITAISPEPPEYRGADVAAYQFKPDKDAAVTVDIYESSGATVNAIIVNDQTGIEYTVAGTEVSTVNKITEWNFMIPTIGADGKESAAGSQDGNWTLKALSLEGVYVDDVYRDSENPLVWTLADMESDNLKTKVVSNIYVTVKEKNQGATEFTGEFMTEHTVDDIQITISDFAGEAIDGISDVKLRYQLTSRNLGDFVYDSELPHERITEADGTIVKTNLISGSSTVYQIEKAINLLYPGRYNTGVQFTLNGNTYIAGVVNENETANFTVANLPSYAVAAWTKPTVKITATDPAAGTSFTSYYYKYYYRKASVTNKLTNEGKNATLYYKASYSGILPDFTPSKVTMQLSNAGMFNTATVSTYDSTNKTTIAFNFNPTGTSVLPTATTSIGTGGNGTYTKVDVSFNSIVLKDADAREFTVTLDTNEIISIVAKAANE